MLPADGDRDGDGWADDDEGDGDGAAEGEVVDVLLDGGGVGVVDAPACDGTATQNSDMSIVPGSVASFLAIRFKTAFPSDCAREGSVPMNRAMPFGCSVQRNAGGCMTLRGGNHKWFHNAHQSFLGPAAGESRLDRFNHQRSSLRSTRLVSVQKRQAVRFRLGVRRIAPGVDVEGP